MEFFKVCQKLMFGLCFSFFFFKKKTATYLVWEKLQFHDDAHFAHFFRITGYRYFFLFVEEVWFLIVIFCSKKDDVDAQLAKKIASSEKEAPPASVAPVEELK